MLDHPRPSSPPGAGQTRPDRHGYALVRPRDPHVALARAVELCARHDAFAVRPFGEWARVLIGQVNRGTFRFLIHAANGDRRTAGFVGWFRAGPDATARWLAGRDNPAHEPGGECVVLNAVVAEGPEALRFLASRACALEAPPFTLCARRVYPDGRTRPVRLPVRSAACPRIRAGTVIAGG